VPGSGAVQAGGEPAGGDEEDHRNPPLTIQRRSLQRGRTRGRYRTSNSSSAAAKRAWMISYASWVTLGRPAISERRCPSPTAAATRYRSLQQLFDWLDEEGKIDGSPMAKTRARRRSPRSL
jgi:hypothetical protein